MRTPPPYQVNAAGRIGKLTLATWLVAILTMLTWVTAAEAAVTNTVTAAGTIAGQPVTATDNAAVDVEDAAPGLTIQKIGTLDLGSNGTADVGDIITYSFRLENTGNVTLNNVIVTDPDATVSGGPLMGFAPGSIDTTTFVATHALTVADITAGHFQNTATANATPSSGSLPLPLPESTFDVPISGTSSMSFTKSATPNFGVNGRADAGDTVAYQFTVTNTGSTTLSNITITDPLVMTLQDDSTARYFAMLDAARTGADPVQTASIDELPPKSDPAVALPEVPQIPASLASLPQLINLSGNTTAPKAGDRIGIVVAVVNTGNAPLYGISVDVAEAQAFSNSITYLAPNAIDESTLIFVHELTEEDVVLGSIKVAVGMRATARDQEITSSSQIQLSLSSAKHYDELVTAVITPSNVATLAPGASTIFTATYTLSQANINSGSLTNNATATATSPTGALAEPASATVNLPPDPQIAAVKTATSSFGTGGIPNVGENVTWTIAVTNPGNVSLSSVTLTDSLPGLSAPVLTGGDANSNTLLDPSETWTYTANYSVTQADIDAGQIANQATVTGTPPTGPAINDLSDESDAVGNDITTLALAPQPLIALIKTAGTPTVNLGLNTSVVDANDTLPYTFTVTNPGNVSLSAVSVTDPLAGLSAITYTSGDSDSDNELDVGESWIFNAVLTLSQQQIDDGSVTNQATAIATPPSGPAISDLSDNTLPATNPALQRPTVTVLPQVKGLTVLKFVSSITDLNGNGLLELGDTINYAFTVTNTGTVTLSPVTVTDSNATISGSIANLAPGATDTSSITATHLVTATDVTARNVTNQATASGKPPTGANVTDLSDPSNPAGNAMTVTPVSEVKVALIKAFSGYTDDNGNGAIDEGDLINYTFSVVNTGTEVLNAITITDPLPGLSAITFTGGDGNSNNAIDPDNFATSANERETWVYEASYTITAADILASNVTNQATVSATGPGATVVSDLSDPSSLTGNQATVTAVGDPQVALIKTAGAVQDTNSNGLNDAGDIITYTFTVTNTGPIPLTNISVADPKVSVSGGPLANLAPGASNSTTFTASYKIKTSDVEAGGVTNQATVTAGSSRGTATDKSDDNDNTQDDATFTPLTAAPSIAIVKTVKSVTDTNGDGINDVGDTINYSFAVTNTGNVTLTDIKVSDPNAVVTGGPLASLKPGATDSITFTAKHLITGADAVTGKVTNQATVSGLAGGTAGLVVSDLSDNKSLSGNSPTVIKVFRTPPSITKVAGKSEVRRGESIGYTITASDLTGFNIAIRDVMPGSFIFVTGSATANGKPVVPKIEGRNLTFTGLVPDKLGKIVIKLRLVAGATITSGRFTNLAQVINRDNGSVIASASATVTVSPEHVFDCGDVIGRVFEDLNSNGYPDDGEPGLAGVKVVTVNGLIITSDSKGRFHVACADIPNAEIGSNFILKLDETSLPDGYYLTTENPRDVRLTRGKVTKLNFGAAHSCDVNLAIRKDAFVANGISLKPKWSKDISRLTGILRQCPGKLSIVYQCGQYAPIADERLAVLESAIRSRWTEEGAPYELPINTRVECGK